MVLLAALNQALCTLAPNAQAVSQAEFQSWIASSNLHRTALFVLALALHLSTLPATAHRFLPAADLLQALVRREQNRWHKAEEGQGLQRGCLADVIGFATLFNGLALADVNTQLAATNGWSAATAQKVHAALKEVWPPSPHEHTYPAMAPDLLAAAFLWHWQNQTHKRGNQQDGQLLAQLAQQPNTHVNPLLRRWNMLAYDQTVRLQLGSSEAVPALQAALLLAAQHHSPFAGALKVAFSSRAGWSGLTALAVRVTKPSTFFETATATELEWAARASELNNHSGDLASAGDRLGALDAIKEAVGIYRRLAENNPAAYEPDLAGSLNNLSNRLSEAGDRSAALDANKEAAFIFEKLDRQMPGVFDKKLAIVRQTLKRLES